MTPAASTPTTPEAGTALRERLVGRVAARLAPVLRGTSSVLVQNAPELAPRELARALAARLASEVVARPLSEARGAGADALLDEAGEDACLLLEQDVDDAGSACLAVLDRAGERGIAPLVIVVAACDEPVPEELTRVFHAVLDEAMLLVVDEDLVDLVEELSDVVARHQLLTLTGGVVDLVLAVLEDGPGAPGTETGLARRTAEAAWGRAVGPTRDAAETVAAAWAERVHARVLAEPVLHLHAFLPVLSPWSVARPATPVLGREVDGEEVELVERSSGLLAGDLPFRSFPPLLAAQLCRLTRETDPALAARLRRDLTDACTDPETDLPARAVITILVGHQAWISLDRWLAAGAVHLAALSHVERLALRDLLPDQVPQGWRHLHSAREFLGLEEVTPHELPQPILELNWLATTCDESRCTPFVREIGARGMSAIALVHSSHVEVVEETLDATVAWVTAEAERLGAATVGDYIMSNAVYDEVVVLCRLLEGVADSAVAMARFSLAQRLLRRAANLIEVCTIDVVRCPVVCVGLAARQALIAAYAGLNDRAAGSLEEYERLARRGGVREPEAEHAVQVARRFLAAGVDHAVRVTAEIPTNSQLTPIEVEAEALLVLVQRGPAAARELIASFLGRAEWTELEPFEWWPLHMLHCLIDLREGRVAPALERAGSVFLPADGLSLVEAAADFVQGRGADCRARLEGLSAMGSASPRWTLVVDGYRLGLLLASDDDSAIEEAVGAHAAAWAEQPGLVALLPDPVRVRILPVLEPVTARQAGLRLDDDGPTTAAPLTPRQVDVLRLLAQGRTLPEIAGELFLGVETVRSTSKALYKRLGVHDRDAAVRVGGLAGLL